MTAYSPTTDTATVKAPAVESAAPPTGSQRDPRFDIARGIALIVVAVNHTRALPGARLHLEMGLRLDFADVFIFVSGLVCGLAYGKRLMNHGSTNTLGHASWRAFQIYFALAVTVLSTMVLLSLVPLPQGDESMLRRMPIDAWAQGWSSLLWLTPARFSYCVDILWLYVFLLLALTPMMWLFQRSRLLAVLVCVGLYAVPQVLMFDNRGARYPYWVGSFDPLGWQAVFFLGVFLTMAKRQRSGGRVLPRGWWVPVACAVGLAATIAVQDHWRVAVWAGAKPNAGLFRIVQLLLLSGLIATALPAESRLWRWRVWLPLVWCGKRSLLTYCLTVVHAYVLTLVMFHSGADWLTNACVQVVGVSVIVVLARTLPDIQGTLWRAFGIKTKPKATA